MPRRRPVPVTDAHLQAAVARTRCWAGRDLADLLADPTAAPLVRGRARAIARAEAAAPAPPARASATGWQPRRQHPGRSQPFDPRRAAANDLDADDDVTP